ncbi:MAG: glutamine synthetase family protein [Myxococcota bacterium]
MAQTKEQVLTQLRERGVERVKVGGFDIDGLLRGKYMSLEKFASVVDKGFGFCDVIFGWDMADVLYAHSSVTGWEKGFPDAQAIVDLDTLRDLPWEPKTAACLVDFKDQHGADHPSCPRSLLKRVAARAKGGGFDVKFSCEFEFFFFQETPESLRDKGFVDPKPLTPGMFGYSYVRTGQNKELMAAILDGMTAFGVPVEGLHTETGPGVYEAALHYSDVVEAADRAALFKVAMKQIAAEHGCSVSFMAKWNADLPGCSGHLHQSLWKRGENVFHEGGGMSTTMKQYVGGLVALMPEMTALISPTINSYKRYVPGVWAPLTASWGVENRTCGVRVIAPDSVSAARVEFRQTAADLNPYIAMATCLGAGLWGIANEAALPPETSGDATEQGEPLPKTLKEATARLADSHRMRTVLGDAFVDHYVHTRRWEVEQFERAVTNWELARYFEAV